MKIKSNISAHRSRNIAIRAGKAIEELRQDRILMEVHEAMVPLLVTGRWHRRSRTAATSWPTVCFYARWNASKASGPCGQKRMPSGGLVNGLAIGWEPPAGLPRMEGRKG